MPRTQDEQRRDRAENIMRILEDFVDVLITHRLEKHSAPPEVVVQILGEHRENLTQEIERLLD